MSDRETVLITGFGPFRRFLVNPSWKAAQELKIIGLGAKVDVYIKEIPVSYSATQQIIAEIWKNLKPKFAVHLGVSSCSSGIIVEQTGKNSRYLERDVCGFCPENNTCITGGPEKLDSVVNMRVVSKICKQQGLDVVYSRDAGRYLCDFAYYLSLYHGERRAAFIHIPSSGSLQSDGLIPLLQTVILTMFQQLEDVNTSSSEADSHQTDAKSH